MKESPLKPTLKHLKPTFSLFQAEDYVPIRGRNIRSRWTKGRIKICRLAGGGIMRLFLTVVVCLALSGCATVHQEDVDAWKGIPVAELETHPIFMTMPVVRTVASDGTEIRRYVNGKNISSCSGGGAAFKGVVDMATYSAFSNCMQTFAACNNIFYIKDGYIQQYIAIGTGGARCYTNEASRPGFRGSTNIR